MIDKYAAVSKLEVGSFILILLSGIFFGVFVYDESGFIKKEQSIELMEEQSNTDEVIDTLKTIEYGILSLQAQENVTERNSLTDLILSSAETFKALQLEALTKHTGTQELPLYGIVMPLMNDLKLWSTDGTEQYPAHSKFVYDLSLQRLKSTLVELHKLEASSSEKIRDTITKYHNQLNQFRGSILTLLLGTISLITLIISLNMKQRQSQSRLATGRKLISDSVNSLDEGVVLTDEIDNCLVINATLAKLIPELNYSLEVGTSFGKAFNEIIQSGALKLIEVQTHDLVRKKEQPRNTDESNISHEYVSSNGTYLRVTIRDRNGGKIITFSDITYLKVAQQQLLYQATVDGMTGLSNRNHFISKLSDAISRSKRHGHKIALMVFDLDKFKQVNDTLGHAVGDELLISVANRIRSSIREIDESGRMGGDEFAAFLDQIKDPQEIRITADRIIKELHQKLEIDGVDVEVSSSIGIAVFPDDADEFSVLLKHADAACYHAKQMGRNNYQMYNRDMKVRAMQQMTMESRLRGAISDGALQLNFQPQLELSNNKICGMEAFLRWNDAKLGSVPPDEFIPLAEKTGLIAQLGEWVIRQALAQIRLWIDEGRDPMPIAVNVSSKQFRLHSLPNIIEKALHDYQVSPDMLALEITEYVIMTDINAAAETLTQLAKRGITLVIDDFGTGSSSLTRLKQLPIHALKIDQSFIKELEHDEGARDISSAIIAIAQTLHIQTIAEGVETQGQATILKQLGCDVIQGYLIGKPVTAAQLPRSLTDTIEPTVQLS